MTINKILVIEDDAIQRQSSISMLAKITNASLYGVKNSKQALEYLAQENKPDLIICDLNMPEIDGLEFLRLISKYNLKTTIILSGYTELDVFTSVQQMAIHYGLKHISTLKKPVSPGKLKTLLRENKDNFHHYLADEVDSVLSEHELIKAIENKELQPFFQPHIDISSGQVTGCEALVRWLHPKRGTLTPNAFLDRIVELGLMERLTRNMLEDSISACSRWHQQGVNYCISVNVTPSDIVNLYFVEYVLHTLAKYQLLPQYLTLEVTENEISPHMAKSIESLIRLRLKGVGISIDDFGTGHSSLMQLITSPFTELKIDQFFIRNMQINNKHWAVVKASIALAKHLGLRSVAEGVETQEQVALLTEMGGYILQGYYFAPALAEAQFISWAKQNNQRERLVQ